MKLEESELVRRLGDIRRVWFEVPRRVRRLAGCAVVSTYLSQAVLALPNKCVFAMEQALAAADAGPADTYEYSVPELLRAVPDEVLQSLEGAPRVNAGGILDWLMLNWPGSKVGERAVCLYFQALGADSGLVEAAEDVVGPDRHVLNRQKSPAWRTRVVLGVAGEIHRERNFSDLPFLADALMDAGADEGEFLRHLRSPGPHHLGCWALDLALGRRRSPEG